VESLWSAEKNRTHRFESVQLQWSLVARGAEREVIPACRTFGLGVLVWSPLASGFLSGKYRRNQPPPAGSRLEVWKETLASVGQDKGFAVIDLLEALAKQYETTVSAEAIAWLLARKETTSVILGARSLAQLEDNLKALEVQLSDEDVKRLDEVSRPDWGYPYEFIGRIQKTW
jgi:aryl-alcohol dehydrogenase-like predicted oxidoreductase